MAATNPPSVVCTPYVGRVIKGWRVQVRICFSVTAAEVALATLWSDFAAVNDGMATLIDALSDASFVQLGSGAFVGAATPGSSGTYDEAEDSAVFSFQTQFGSVGKVSIPAPKATIFLADNQTIDPANTDVGAFTAALLSGNIGGKSGFFGSSKSGAIYSSFLGGLRIRRKTRRKYNIFVRNPELSAPGI